MISDILLLLPQGETRKMGHKSTYHIISHDQLLTLTRSVVNRYSFKGAIPKRDRDDVTMTIVEKFLSSEKKITESFKGDSKITTYCIAILNRMCCEVIRKDFKRWKEVQEIENINPPDIPTHHFDASKNTIIQSELKRFKQLLEFTNNEQYKIILFLKFIMNVEFTKNDVKLYFPEDYINIFENLNNNKNESLGNKYKLLAETTNATEGTKIAGDAIRMWLNKHTSTIIARLNDKGQSAYDKETLVILLEYL